MEGREREGPQVTVEPGPLRALLRHCTAVCRQLFDIPIANCIDSTDETDVLLTIAFVSHKLYNAESDDDRAQYGK